MKFLFIPLNTDSKEKAETMTKAGKAKQANNLSTRNSTSVKNETTGSAEVTDWPITQYQWEYLLPENTNSLYQLASLVAL